MTGSHIYKFSTTVTRVFQASFQDHPPVLSHRSVEMDQHECSVYVYLPFRELTSALEERLSGINIQIINCKPEQFTQISEEALDEIRRNAVVLFSSPVIISKVLQRENRLQWAQSFTAGVDFLMKGLSECPSGVQLTRMGEGWENSMAEYVLGHIIARERHFNVLSESHREKIWDRRKVFNVRPLSSLTVGILGVGRIGTYIAKTLKSFGMEIVGLRLHTRQLDQNSPFKEVWQRNAISQFLEECDYVVSVLPGTSETKYMLSGEVLRSCMKKKPYFINIGRGNIIDRSTIERAIRENWISGALLDVNEKEPLPPEDPLWDVPNVTITPHISGIPNIRKMADLFARNLDKFMKKEPLEYTFDWNSGY